MRLLKMFACLSFLAAMFTLQVVEATSTNPTLKFEEGLEELITEVCVKPELYGPNTLVLKPVTFDLAMHEAEFDCCISNMQIEIKMRFESDMKLFILDTFVEGNSNVKMVKHFLEKASKRDNNPIQWDQKKSFYNNCLKTITCEKKGVVEQTKGFYIQSKVSQGQWLKSILQNHLEQLTADLNLKEMITYNHNHIDRFKPQPIQFEKNDKT